MERHGRCLEALADPDIPQLYIHGCHAGFVATLILVVLVLRRDQESVAANRTHSKGITLLLIFRCLLFDRQERILLLNE